VAHLQFNELLSVDVHSVGHVEDVVAARKRYLHLVEPSLRAARHAHV